MYSRNFLFAPVVAFVLFGSSLVQAGQLRSGIGVRVVTPDPLLPVSGGVGASNPTTKKLGELTVRALVLEDGATRVAIVGSDFLGFPSALGNKVRAKISGIPPKNIFVRT